MRYLTILTLLAASTALAGPLDCDRIEYAELKDMSTNEQVKQFCRYRTNFLVKEYFFNKQRAVYKGKEDLMTPKTTREFVVENKKVEACKEEVDRVERLLRQKQVAIDTIECKCPEGYAYTQPFMRCSL